MLDTRKAVNNRKNIEQNQFNNSIDEFKCKSLIKSNLARKKTVINSNLIFTATSHCPIFSCYEQIRGVNKLLEDKTFFYR